MSYGEILTGMFLGACAVVLLAGPSWWTRGRQLVELRRRLAEYRKDWKP
jgi:hypothetical protein